MLKSDLKNKESNPVMRKIKKTYCKERGEGMLGLPVQPRPPVARALMLDAENTLQTETTGFLPVQSLQRKWVKGRDGL